MAANPKPVIVLVHGAWHVPAHYQPFIHGLEQAGFEVHCPLLPTCARPTSTTLSDDVDVVRALLDCVLAGSNKNVIVVAHSYGGVVATEALRGFSVPARQAQSLPGGVLHVVYMVAFVPQVGQSVGQISQPRPDPEQLEIAQDGTSFLCVDTTQLFYADVEARVAAEAVGMLVRHSFAAFQVPLTYAAWKDIPSTYLRATRDAILFPAWQDKMIEAVKAEGVDLEVQTYEASHSLFLSLPDGMVETVDDVARRYVK